MSSLSCPGNDKQLEAVASGLKFEPYLWSPCDVPNSRGNKAEANLRPIKPKKHSTKA